ncbi:MAG: substrate-binding domain-containing protein [Gallionella sp.]
MKKLTLVAFLLLTAMSTALAEPMVVIVNSANTQNLSVSDVKNIYRDRTTTWDNGNKIKVYNLPSEFSGTEVFAAKVLGVSAHSAAAAEANRIVTNTSRNPQFTKREVLIVSIVSRKPNAIGYVHQNIVSGKEGIRILLTLE